MDLPLVAIVTTVAIRPAAACDLDRLTAIEEAAFETDRIARSSFARTLTSKATHCLVAEAAGQVVGYALVHFRSNSRKARLFSLARAPRAPRGCGRALLAAAEAAARKLGCTALRLEVREDNTRALELYARAGYRLFGRRAKYYEDGAAALRLEKALVIAKTPARSAGRSDRKPRRRATVR